MDIDKNYIPFGEEWKKELMKFNKKSLIELHKVVCIENQKERFIMPTDKEMIEIGIMFLGGNKDVDKLTNIVSVLTFILDRLYENGSIELPSCKEILDSDGDYECPICNRDMEMITDACSECGFNPYSKG